MSKIGSVASFLNAACGRGAKQLVFFSILVQIHLLNFKNRHSQSKYSFKKQGLSRVRRHFQKKSGKQIVEQTKIFKKTFVLATKSLENNFVTNQWTDRQMDGQMDRCTNGRTAR